MKQNITKTKNCVKKLSPNGSLPHAKCLTLFDILVIDMRSFSYDIHIRGVTLGILTIYPPVSGNEGLTTEPQSD